MNLYKAIRNSISPKQYARDKGVGYSRARQKLNTVDDTTNNWAYRKLKTLLEQYEQQMKQ